MVALEDLRTVVGEPVYLVWPTDQQHESYDLRSVTTLCEDGCIYIYYSCATKESTCINCMVLSETQETAALTPQAAYLALYDLLPPDGQNDASAPESLPCLAGESADMKVIGHADYTKQGVFIGNGQALMIPSLAVGDKPYQMHMAFSFSGSMAGAHRLLYVPTSDVNVMVVENGYFGAACLKYETSSSAFDNMIGMENSVRMKRNELISITMDIVVKDDLLTVTTRLTNAMGKAGIMVDMLSCPGFTAALSADGLYIGNRANGDRAIKGRVEAFWVAEVNA